MFEKKRMHPITIVSNIFMSVKDYFFPIIAFLFIGIAGEKKMALYYLIGGVAAVLLILISAIVSWLRFVYWIEDQEIRIESGLFIRNKRYIPFDRIQSISTSQGILQQLFDLVKMRIETAGGGTEATLTAIPLTEAEQIQRYIKDVKRKQEQTASEIGTEQEGGTLHTETVSPQIEEREQIFSLSIGEVFLVALTSGGAIGVIVGVLAIASEFEQILPVDRMLDSAFEQFWQSVRNDIVTGLLIALFVLVIAYIVAIIQSMLKYANFKVEKTDKNLIVSHGLLERRSVHIPLNRIQGFVIYEGFIRKLFGLASVSIINAGVSDREELSGEVVIAPLIQRARCAQLIETCLPEYSVDVPFHPVPKRAKRRYILRPIYILIVPVLLGVYFLKIWGWLMLLTLPFFGFLGFKAYRFAGWNITDKQLTLRSRFFTARTVYVFKHRIQSFDIRKTWFQRRKQLATVFAHILSGRGVISGKTIDVDAMDAEKIYRWLRGEEENIGPEKDKMEAGKLADLSQQSLGL